MQASVPGMHSPAHLPVAASQMYIHAAAWSSTHVPLVLQVCGLPALHCLVFGEQAAHRPIVHGIVPHAVLSFQWLVASQDWTVLPEQRSAVPGEHSPLQLLVAGSQTNVHATAAPQCPFASQVSTPFGVVVEHRETFGAQSPAQTPLPVHAPAHTICIWFVPESSQRSGVLLAPQDRVPGLHDPPQATASPVPVHAKGHVMRSRQTPPKSHCCKLADGPHRLVPGWQRTMQSPVAGSQVGLSIGQAARSSNSVPCSLHF